MRDNSWYLGVKIKQPQLILLNRKSGRRFNVLLCHHVGEAIRVLASTRKMSQYLRILSDQK